MADRTRRGLAWLLLGPWTLALAQAGDAPPLEVIALPGAAPQTSRLTAPREADCSALMLSQARRYRAGHCGDSPDGDETDSVERIELQLHDESARADY